MKNKFAQAIVYRTSKDVHYSDALVIYYVGYIFNTYSCIYLIGDIVGYANNWSLLHGNRDYYWPGLVDELVDSVVY